MMTDMHVLQSDGMMLLDLPAPTAEASLARLDQFHFAEDVDPQANLAGSLTSLWLHGPRAAAVLETADRCPSGSAPGFRISIDPCSFQGTTGRRGPGIDQLGVPGYCVFVALCGAETRCARRSAAAGVVPCRRRPSTAARVEADIRYSART
jgi:hypothetical protein